MAIVTLFRVILVRPEEELALELLVLTAGAAGAEAVLEAFPSSVLTKVSTLNLPFALFEI